MTMHTTSHLTKAARLGVEWLIDQQRADGSLADVQEGIGAYYKAPCAFLLGGRIREAQRLLQWVAKNHFTAQGDFRGPQRKANEAFHEAWPVYANAWLVQGAHWAGRWDLSLRGAEFLRRYQTASGGFYALDGQTPFQEPVCTSWGGMAMLTTGHVNEACRAGDLLAKLARCQPDPNRLYFRMDTDGNLITDVPAGAELGHFVDAARTQQIYYNPGIALIFLMQLYRATRNETYLEAGKTLFEFTERCAEDVHCFPPSGKLGMGAALLHAITGNPKARQAAMEVGKYLADTQTPDGSWILPDVEVYAGVKDRAGYEIRADVSAEFCTFLLGIASLV